LRMECVRGDGSMSAEYCFCRAANVGGRIWICNQLAG
jgi:hypothetical protein